MYLLRTLRLYTVVVVKCNTSTSFVKYSFTRRSAIFPPILPIHFYTQRWNLWFSTILCKRATKIGPLFEFISIFGKRPTKRFEIILIFAWILLWTGCSSMALASQPIDRSTAPEVNLTLPYPFSTHSTPNTPIHPLSATPSGSRSVTYP